MTKDRSLSSAIQIMVILSKMKPAVLASMITLRSCVNATHWPKTSRHWRPNWRPCVSSWLQVVKQTSRNCPIWNQKSIV